MRPEILSLGFVHFHEACEHICTIPFSDGRKKKFCTELRNVSQQFLSYDTTAFTPDIIKNKKSDLDFLWQWALALDDRNGYTLSHEMRTTMDNLCSHWVKDYPKFIFAATDGNFAIVRYASDWDVLMKLMENIYGQKFSHQLITFNVPKHLYKDFLFVSIIYHEMGHFIDSYYNLSDEVARRMKNRLVKSDDEERIRKEFFPIVQLVYDDVNCQYTDEKKRDEYIENYVGEYIADLFGSQYVGGHILNHIELNRHGTYGTNYETHPSPIARLNLVNAFLKDDRTNFLLTDILDTFKDTGLELKNRYVRPADASNLEKGLPIAIANDDELHSVFQLGWEVYFKGAKVMDAACGTAIGATGHYDFYQRLNEAIRQSIRNYLG